MPEPAMFTADEIRRMQETVQAQTRQDKALLDELLEDVDALKGRHQHIRPRSGTTLTLMASDGGNIQLEFDPFQIQVVRVVDSKGKLICFDILSPTTNQNDLFQRQFHNDGSPRTPLGRLLADLNLQNGTFHDLSPFIPRPDETPEPVRQSRTNWVQSYRDLMEWAALYDLICYRDFGADCLIVRDGLLRGYVFRAEIFSQLMQRIGDSIQHKLTRDRCRLYLVGIAKRSKILDRYNLAMNIAHLLPRGHPVYLEVPPIMEQRTFRHLSYWEHTSSADSSLKGARRGFNAGQLYFVRFGKHSGDRVWAVDVLRDQIQSVSEILGHLLHDAVHGFPIALYPNCLQLAHEYARIEPMDAIQLQDAVVNAARNMLPRAQQGDFDRHVLQTRAWGTAQ